MTYEEIVKQALAHLEYGTDQATLDTFGERFMIYANDAVREIAIGLKMDRVETVTLEDGCFSIGDLTKEPTKIVEVKKGCKAFPFVRGDMLGDFKVIGCKDGDTVDVRYRYVPDNEAESNKEPEIPKIFHPIIYLYVVHCHQNTRATSSDYDRTKWLQQFNAQRRRLMKQAYGSLDTYAWKNRPWDTGEM